MRKSFWRVSLATLAAALVCAQATAPAAYAGGRTSRLGTVTGLVRDNKGQPLAGAVIQFVKEGAGHVVKQTSTTKDGTFTARVLPGKYLLTALAQGFNSVSFNAVQINPSRIANATACERVLTLSLMTTSCSTFLTVRSL